MSDASALPSAPFTPFMIQYMKSAKTASLSLLAEGPQQAEQHAAEIARSELGDATQVGTSHIIIRDVAPCSWADFFYINADIKDGWSLPDPPPGFTTPCVLTYDSTNIVLDWTRYARDFASDYDELRGFSEIEWPFRASKSPPSHCPTAADWLRVGMQVR